MLRVLTPGWPVTRRCIAFKKICALQWTGGRRLGGKPFTAFGAPCVEDPATSHGGLAGPETVAALAHQDAGLKCPFHSNLRKIRRRRPSTWSAFLPYRFEGRCIASTHRKVNGRNGSPEHLSNRQKSTASLGPGRPVATGATIYWRRQHFRIDWAQTSGWGAALNNRHRDKVHTR